MSTAMPAYVEFRGDFGKLGKEITAKVKPMASQFGQLAVSQSKAHKTTGLLDKGTHRLGGTLARAAKYAAGAAAAYISIAQAKAAVTNTLELSKATSGLNRNLGLSVNVASRWGAVAKARDIDAKSMTMSFTTLSRKLVEAAHSGGQSMTAFNRLGISQAEVEKGSKNFEFGIMRVAKAFGEAEGGAKRQASAQELLGRGYSTILPLFSEGTKSLKEQLHWADEFGVTLNTKTNDSLMELVSLQRESKVATLGLQVAFTRTLTPALVEAQKEYQGFARLFARDDLSGSEKWEIAGKRIEHMADVALNAFNEVLPEISSKAGQWAPKIAGSFVKGFTEADIWGKLFLGGAVAAKMLGSGGMGKLGSKMGKQWSAAFLLAVLGTELAKEVKRIIEGHKLGDTPREETAANLKESFAVPTAAVKFQGKDRIRIATEIGDLIFNAQTERVVGAKGDQLEQFVGKIPAEMLTKFNRLKHLRTVFRNSLQPLPGDARTTGSGINQALLPKLDELVNRGGNKADRFASTVGGSFGNLSGSVRGALDNINQNITSALEGLNVGKVPKFQLKKYVSMLPSVKSLGKQRGGPINIGAPSGDSVPALLERGEYVVNREAVKKVGVDTLDRINFNAAPRFQKGGGIGSEPKIAGTDPLRSFGQAGIHKVFAAASAYMDKHRPSGAGGPLGSAPGALGAVERLASQFGLQMTSGYRPGDDGFHGINRARDFSNGVATKQEFAFGEAVASKWGSRLLELIHTPLGYSIDNGRRVPPFAQADHYDHVHVAMQRGGLLGAIRKMISGGFVKGNYTVKHHPASAAQTKIAEEIMTGGDRSSAPRLARVASMMAGIQESELGASSSNVFQLTGAKSGSSPGAGALDQAVAWFTKGFYGKGGGNALSRTMKDPGAIAQAVEGSAYPSAYSPWKGESQDWVEGWGGDGAAATPDDIPKLVKGTTKGGKTSKGGGTIAGAHYKVTTDRLSSFGQLPDDLDACNKELRIRQRELGEYRAAAAQAKDKDVKAALKTNVKLLEIRVAALRKQRRRLVIEAMTSKAVARIAKAAHFEAWTTPNTGIFARGLEAYERAQERAEEIMALEPEVPISGATASWVDTALKSYVEGAESPAFARVLGSEASRRNAFIAAEQFAGNRMEGWRVDIEKLHNEIEFIQALKDSDPKAYEKRKVQIPGMQDRMKELRANIVTTRTTTLPEWEDALSGVQGHGRTHALLDALPGIPTGEFGGDIFQTQLSIKELGLKVPQALAGLGEERPDGSRRIANLEELLRHSNQRNLTAEVLGRTRQQFEGSYPFMGEFAKGGVALVGERGPELAHMPSGTRIHSAGDTAQMLRPEVRIEQLVVHEDGSASMRYDGHEFEVAVERVSKRSRPLGRPTPGGRI